MEWVDGNIGSKVTMKYPAVWMTGEHAKGEVLSIAFAGEGQHQDAGAKMVHAAPHTSSTIISKSVARGGGRTSYRGLVQVDEGAYGRKSTVKCDALLVDTISRSDTYPYVDVREDDVAMGHEATVSRVSEDQLFYLMSRGLTEDEAMAMIVRGFVEPIARELPDGVRARAQPPDRTADGRCRRLMSAPHNRALTTRPPSPPTRPLSPGSSSLPAWARRPVRRPPRPTAPVSPPARTRTAAPRRPARRPSGSPRPTPTPSASPPVARRRGASRR